MPAEALQWIRDVLTERNIPFSVCGGLAAIGYGSERALHDIDLFVPGKHFQEVVAAGKEYVSKPARHYEGEGWSLEYIQFLYAGTKIEVGNAQGAKIWDVSKRKWVDLPVDFNRTSIVEVLGVPVPLMDAESLVAYKEILGREVDHADVTAILGAKS